MEYMETQMDNQIESSILSQNESYIKKEKQKGFFGELADLMEKYDAKLFVESDYSQVVDGCSYIGFVFGKGNQYPLIEVEADDSLDLSADEIRKLDTNKVNKDIQP